MHLNVQLLAFFLRKVGIGWDWEADSIDLKGWDVPFPQQLHSKVACLDLLPGGNPCHRDGKRRWVVVSPHTSRGHYILPTQTMHSLWEILQIHHTFGCLFDPPQTRIPDLFPLPNKTPSVATLLQTDRPSWCINIGAIIPGPAISRTTTVLQLHK